ncbi:MAG: PEP-CTERM sorting domain-containing protein [Acidobacteria bacterium]|nr:PEP-CTERM sorting domain-containing protein [Acidobacteriota bacterium]
MTKLLLIAAACALHLPGALLTVANHSFESPTLGTVGGASGIISSWTGSVGSSSLTLRPSAAQLSGGPADGLQVLYMNLGSRFQTLADVLTANTVYTLSVAVGNRNDLSMASYLFTLEAGSTVIATASAPPNSIPADGDMDDVTISYTALAGDPLLGQALTIRLSHVVGTNDNHALYDNVRLDASAITTGDVPEPASMLLAAAGLLLLPLRRQMSSGR